jgi:hypothetical protein
LDKIFCQHIMLTRQMYNYEHKYLRCLSIGVRRLNSTLSSCQTGRFLMAWQCTNISLFPSCL